MNVSTTTFRAGARSGAAWLRSQTWDLTWISLSVVLVATPYLVYLGILNLSAIFQPVAGFFGASICICQAKRGPFVSRKGDHLGLLT